MHRLGGHGLDGKHPAIRLGHGRDPPYIRHPPDRQAGIADRGRASRAARLALAFSIAAGSCFVLFRLGDRLAVCLLGERQWMVTCLTAGGRPLARAVKKREGAPSGVGFM